MLCTFTSNIYSFLGNAGVYDLPFIGEFLQNFLSFIFDSIGCH